jgi:hypothetical protein
MSGGGGEGKAAVDSTYFQDHKRRLQAHTHTLADNVEHITFADIGEEGVCVCVRVCA